VQRDGYRGARVEVGEERGGKGGGDGVCEFGGASVAEKVGSQQKARRRSKKD
jgi:hypothetical protein